MKYIFHKINQKNKFSVTFEKNKNKFQFWTEINPIGPIVSLDANIILKS